MGGSQFVHGTHDVAINLGDLYELTIASRRTRKLVFYDFDSGVIKFISSLARG